MNRKKENIELMEIVSKPENINQVEARTEHLAKELGFNEDDCVSLGIAVTEVVANAITHGNKRDQNKKVKVKFVFTDKVFEIHIRDQGPGFKPDSIDDPLKPENLLKESGRGIFIVRSLMDKVEYNFFKDGSEVVLIKNIPSPKK